MTDHTNEQLAEFLEEMAATYYEHTRSRKLAAAAARLREMGSQRDAILWACGVNGDFPPRPEGAGAYWWRTELMRRAGISGKEITAAACGKPVPPQPAGGEGWREKADGVGLIAAERTRQVEKEGWTADHDDTHGDSELALAAATYALPDKMRGRKSLGMWEPPRDTPWEMFVPKLWPWNYNDWKPDPNNRVRELVRAGALLAAEIDRLQRAALAQAPSPPDAPQPASEAKAEPAAVKDEGAREAIRRWAYEAHILGMSVARKEYILAPITEPHK